MARHIRFVLSTLVLGALVACGGGGGGGGGPATSISASPSSITFNAVEGDPSPLAAQILTITYQGAAVVAGYAPGVAAPAWLAVSQNGTATATSAAFSLVASDTSTVGTRSVSVRFATGLADETQVKYVDVPVTFNVTASDLAISSNTSSLNFTANTGGALPASQNVSLTFNGTSLSVSGIPTWLTLTPPANQNASPATFGVAVNTSAYAAGTTLTADLMFATSRSPNTLQRTATVHVTYTVVQPFDATTTTTPLAFNGIAKSTQAQQPAAGYAVAVEGSNVNWSVSADQPWIQFSPPNGTSPGTVMVTASSANVGKGAFTGNVTIADSLSSTTRTFPVSLTNRAANLTTSPTSLTFNVDSTTLPAALTQTVRISDELNSAQASEAVTWTLQPGYAAWLQFTPSSGSSVPAVQASGSLKISELQKLTPGQYTTTVTLSAVNSAGGAQTVTIPVTLNYQPAYVSYVGPYLGIANQAGYFYARGANFAATAAPVSVEIGATEIANVAPDGDTQLHVNYPALAAGTYPVSVKNAAGIVASNATLVLINAATLTYHAISAPSPHERLAFDAERQTLYAVNRTSQQIEPYIYASGSWTAGTPYVIPQITDVALSTNGRLLLALTTSSVEDIPLTGAPFIATPRASEPSTSEAFSGLSITNDGNAFLTTECLCSGFTSSYLYNISSYQITQNPYFIGYFYDGIAGASADGSRVYGGSNGVSPAQPIAMFNSLDHSITNSPPAVAYNLNAVSASGNASRVILQGTDVYSADLTLLGYLPTPLGVTLASRDSSRAYVFRDDAGGGGPRLDIYDLNGTLQSGALFPLLKTVTLADDPIATSGIYTGVSMAETPDGNTVFIGGNSKILVVPVN